MSVPKWPFERVWPSGIADGEVPGGADLTKLDEQQSRAANGALWTDVALFRNFTKIATGEHVPTIGYDPASGNWFAFGLPTGPSPMLCRTSFDDGMTWEVLTTGAIGAHTPRALAFDGAGTIVLSYTPSASSASKAVWTSDQFATLTAITTGASTTGGGDISYSKLLSLWFLRLDDGSLWSAATPGGTWTQRLATGSGATPVVDGADRVASGPHYSFDGSTWTGVTLPGTGNLLFVPQPAPGKFLLDVGGVLSASSDYITWTLVNGASVGRPSLAYGRVLLGFGSMGGVSDLLYSFDLGASWVRARMCKISGGVNQQYVAMGADRAIVVLSQLATTDYMRGNAAGF